MCLRTLDSWNGARCPCFVSTTQRGPPLSDFTNRISSLESRRPRWRTLPQARPPPRTTPSRGVRGQPASINNVRTPLARVSLLPTIVEDPVRKRYPSSFEIARLEPTRFASPARIVKLVINHSTPALRSRSLELRKERYSATSLRPAKRAFCSASAKAAAQASSSSLTSVSTRSLSTKSNRHYVAPKTGRWYHDRRIVPHLDPVVRILLKNKCPFLFARATAGAKSHE